MNYKKYNVKELQEKNKQIIEQNLEEKGEVLSENIPRETLEKAGFSVGGVKEQKRKSRKNEIRIYRQGNR